MKKIIFTLSLVISALVTQAQLGCFWHENFDAPSLDDSVFSYSSDTTLVNTGWAINSRLQVSPDNCDSAAIINIGDTLILTTDSMDLTGMTYVILEFDHICKVDFFDVAIIEVSFDGGANWFQMTDSEYLTDDLLPPGAPFGAQNNQFSAASYAIWQPANPNAIPDNTWWKHEIFDISSWAGNFTEVQVRFKLYDSNTLGGNGNNGWKVENICITAAPCELTPPTLAQLPIIWQNTVYNLGPYTVNVDAADNSGLASVWLYYTISPVPGTLDSVQLTNISGNTFQGQIPAVSDSDTVCYYFVATDASACANQTTSGTKCFNASTGVTYPYCDNFDFQNLWVDSTTVLGTIWELGSPAWGFTTGALSAPNAWDVNLNSAYTSNADAELYSPIFQAVIPNAKLNFYHKFATEQTWDGARLDYSTDGGGTWAPLGDFANSCGCQTNWYTEAALNSSGLPGWSGNSSAEFPPPLSTNGWVKSEYSFPPSFPFGPQIQFRFVFTSDAIIEVDGYSIDDFCVTLPQPFDAGVPLVIEPGISVPAGSCQPVIVTLQNFGINALTSFDVYYTVDTVLYGPFPWTGNLAPGATEIDTLPCFIVPPGAFNLCAYTSFATDGNPFNDTSCVTVVGIPILSLSSCDDMESGNQGFLTFAQTGSTQWQLGTPAFGFTTGAHSPVNAWDVNLTTSYFANDSCALNTPIYDVATAVNPSFSFWQNRNLGATDGMRIDYSTNSGLTWNIMWSGVVPEPPNVAINWYNDPNVNFTGFPGWTGSSGGWEKSTYFFKDILAAAGNPNYIQFRFVFRSSFNTPVDGVSVDDICVTQPTSQDAGVVQINNPVSGPFIYAGNTSPVNITFQNFGSSPITTTNITWALNGVPMDTVTFNGNILPGDLSSIITMNPSFTIPSGEYTICAYTQLIADGDTTNDTTCTVLVGVPTLPLSYTINYCDDFEASNIGWVMQVNPGGDVGSRWEEGAPAWGATSSAHSGTQAWDINLNSPYTLNANVTLYSPVFDFTNANDVKLNFWRNHNTQQGGDGVRVEYTTDGITWIMMGNVGSPNPPYVNWYGSTINCSALPGWSGSSSVWVQSQMLNLGLLPNVNGGSYIRFRFTFCSDTFGTSDGFSIDDFCLEVPVPLSASPTSIANSTTNFPCIFEGQSITFNSTVKNKGTIALSSVNATLLIDGTAIVTDSITYAPVLAPGASQNHTFSVPWTATPGNHTVCAVTGNPNSQSDQNPTDDTICYTIQICDTVGIASGASYCTDFESGPSWATFNALSPYTPNTSWQFGTPNKGAWTSALSGANAWVTDLTANYPNKDTSGLFTPAFNIQGNGIYKLSFSHKYQSEIWQDGGVIDYSSDYGVSWNRLGDPGQGSNWYNAYFITALGGTPYEPGWSGTLPVWQLAEHEICFGSPSPVTVLFRFRFMSDPTVNDLGWMIDDFCFEDINTTCITGIDEQATAANFSLGQNYPNPTDGTTSIEYTIPKSGSVQLSIINVMGQTVDVVVEQNQSAGKHSVTFDSNHLAPGIYYYQLIFNNDRLVKKMVVAN